MKKSLFWRGSTIPESLTGGALGLLVGMLLGLSTEPVVGALMTGLVALLASFFGFGSGLLPGGGATSQRLVGFCLATVAAALIALAARTHDILSPRAPQSQSIQSFVSDLKALDFPEAKIEDFVAAKYFGILPVGATAVPLRNPADGKASTVFFDTVPDDCNSLPQIADRSLAERLNFLDSMKNSPLAALATRVRQFPENQKEAAYSLGTKLLCGAP
jgi:hypothetical protein